MIQNLNNPKQELMYKKTCKKIKSPHNRGDFLELLCKGAVSPQVGLSFFPHLVLSMFKTTFILISKRVLTHDVYELVYSCPDLVKDIPKPGQYVMFQLAPGLNRSYSLASFTTDSFTLVIKRVTEGKGSSIICNAEIGQVFSGMLPLGHFMLRDTVVSKCFIGTGTGFAPLYCQMLACTSLSLRVAFVF